jgi:hypothetical protein
MRAEVITRSGATNACAVGPDMQAQLITRSTPSAFGPVEGHDADGDAPPATPPP